MIKIKLQRRGKKGDAHYRVVVAESHRARDSKYIDDLGYYNPHENPSKFEIDQEKAKSWLQKGAQPTETVAQFFVKLSLMPKAKRGSTLAVPKPKKKDRAKKA